MIPSIKQILLLIQLASFLVGVLLTISQVSEAIIMISLTSSSTPIVPPISKKGRNEMLRTTTTRGMMMTRIQIQGVTQQSKGTTTTRAITTRTTTSTIAGVGKFAMIQQANNPASVSSSSSSSRSSSLTFARGMISVRRNKEHRRAIDGYPDTRRQLHLVSERGPVQKVPVALGRRMVDDFTVPRDNDKLLLLGKDDQQNGSNEYLEDDQKAQEALSIISFQDKSKTKGNHAISFSSSSWWPSIHPSIFHGFFSASWLKTMPSSSSSSLLWSPPVPSSQVGHHDILSSSSLSHPSRRSGQVDRRYFFHRLPFMAAATTTMTTITTPFRTFAFEGGVGGLGKTKPNTGVIFYSDGMKPIQDPKDNMITAEIRIEDQYPVLVRFMAPWPLLATTSGLEARDPLYPESAFVQVVSPSLSSTRITAPTTKAEWMQLLLDSVFAQQGKYSAYGSPMDIKVKPILDNFDSSSTGNPSQQQQRPQQQHIALVTFTALTPALRESLRQVYIQAYPMYNSLVLLITGTTQPRFNVRQETFQQVIRSFQVVATPTSTMKRIRVQENLS